MIPIDALLKPIITEKTSALKTHNTYVFKVLPSASKVQLRNAIEKIFSTKVLKIQVLNYRPRKKINKMRKTSSSTPGQRRAYVRLKKGLSIKELNV